MSDPATKLTGNDTAATLVVTNRSTQPPTGATQPLSYTAGSLITFDDGYASAQQMITSRQYLTAPAAAMAAVAAPATPRMPCALLTSR